MIKKIKNWINEQIQKIKESNDEEFKVKIEECKVLLERFKNENAAYIEYIIDLNTEIEKLKNNTYDFSKQFSSVKTKYYWKPNKQIYLHESLNNFSKDYEYQEKYLAFLKELGLKDYYKDVDSAVFDIVILIQKYINVDLRDDYKTDREVFGVNEYWLSPQEAFDQYVINDLATDCEDTSALLYASIISGLNYLGFEYENRLLRVDIDFPVGHALVSWRKLNNVWAGIESTYGEERFTKNWNRNKDVFKGIYTGIWHIFDEVSEYILKY